jgi:effector-binding domain-containing protein
MENGAAAASTAHLTTAMFKIGDFSKLSRVSVKTLRYYDEVGLLKPIQIDRFTGYRFYSVDQLPRLNRILALKDLGFSLEQIARLLDEDVSPSELRGMLRLKQGELQQQVEEQQSRLARVEARLKQIEQESGMSAHDVVLKRVESQMVASVRETIPTYSDIGQLFTKLFAELGQQGVKPGGPVLAIYYDAEHLDQGADVEVAVPVAAPFVGKDISARQLPGNETMACLIHQGSYDLFGQSYTGLMTWIEANGYHLAGPSREIYLRGPESGGDPSSYVTEIQVPVEKN